MINVKYSLPTTSVDYLRFSPPDLHKEAKDFVVYVAYKPFEKPKCCLRCGSRSFRTEPRRKQNKLIQYCCRSCNKPFSSVTGTPLMRVHSHDEWEDVAVFMLAGIHDEKARMEIGTYMQFISREQALEIVMREDFPNLYKWW